MNAEVFIKLSKEGEGTKVEYKTCAEKISESLYETVCSFLNHSGGKILVGVKDNGKIVGVNPDKAEALKNSIITAIKNPELFYLARISHIDLLIILNFYYHFLNAKTLTCLKKE